MPRKYLLPLFVLVLLAFSIKTRAQNYSVQVHGVDSLPKIIDRSSSYPSQDEALAYVQGLVPKLQQDGYLAASVDSIGVGVNGYDIYVFAGQRYQWARLSLDGLPPALLVNTGIIKQKWEGRPVQPDGVAALTKTILNWCDVNGYPFARVGLDSVIVADNGGVQGVLAVDMGGKRWIDTVVMEGNLRLSRTFLERYLDIKAGSPYSEQKLRTISPRLRELPYLQESQPWNIQFKRSNTRLNLYLKEKNANQINALIGLVPEDPGTKKLRLTVDALFAFQNILGHGEQLSFSFQNLQYKSPRLKLDGVWPYLFGTLFGAEVHFEFYQRDTTFSRTSLQLGTRYQISAQDYLRIYYENSGNRVITIDTAYVRSNHKLPDNVDVRANGGGAELFLNRTNYRLNPRKGWTVRLQGSALSRTVRRNDAILGLRDGTGFDYGQLYDTLSQQRYQYRMTTDLAAYTPIGKTLVVKTSVAGGYISSSRLFQNELFLIGGFRLLRGFDEESIFATTYGVTTVELRALLGRNSYAFLFTDNGWVQSKFNDYDREGWYHGFGGGATLETKTGLFTIGYAIGKGPTQELQFRQSKIHFGYAAYF